MFLTAFNIALGLLLAYVLVKLAITATVVLTVWSIAS